MPGLEHKTLVQRGVNIDYADRMQKALILSYANLSRPVTGGARRVNELLKALGDTAFLIQPPPSHPTCESVLFPTDFGRHKVGINWGIFNLFWPRNRSVARRVIAERKPAVIVLTSIWNHPPLGRAGMPLLLDAQNVEAVAIGERFGRNHPFTRIVNAYERKVARRAQHLFVCSGNDRDLFMSLYGIPESRITVVPNGAELEPEPVSADAEREARVFLDAMGDCSVLFFMGKLDYQPNAEALRFMSDTLMPALEREAPGRFKLLVCGGPVPRESFDRSMIFTGRVPSLTPYLRRADLCLAPISTGSGTRLKVLEYLGAKKAVVATAKAAEGLGCASGEQLILAEPGAFAREIVRLAGDAAARDRLAAAGFEFVRAHYDWAKIRERWKQVIGTFLK
jgi:glycosyltransferase involved in cell wall biosynthesis